MSPEHFGSCYETYFHSAQQSQAQVGHQLTIGAFLEQLEAALLEQGLAEQIPQSRKEDEERHFYPQIHARWRKGQQLPGRELLLVMMAVLTQLGGIRRLADADAWMEAAGYGQLSELEKLTYLPSLRAISNDGKVPGGLANPYPGLQPFTVEQSQFYFGRAAFITEKLLPAVQQKPFVALVGPSGAGKSSLIHAGLSPQLLRTGDWHIIAGRPFRPRPDTFFHNIVHTLFPRAGNDRLARDARALQQGETSLHDLVSAAVDTDAFPHVLLFIDQFEELYTSLGKESEATAIRFWELMARHIAQSEAASFQLTVLINVRADFTGRLLQNGVATTVLQDNDLFLGPLSQAELAEIIEEPAAEQKIVVDRALTQRLLDETGQFESHLPLLQFALHELWKTQRALTLAAYNQMCGNLEEVLATHADRVFQTELNPAEQVMVRQLFLKLVQSVHLGDSLQFVKRVVDRQELADIDAAVIELLTERRLLVASYDQHRNLATVELAHEAIIEHWQRLATWLEADRAFFIWRADLQAPLRQWLQAQDEGLLLRGAALATAEGYLETRPQDLRAEEMQLIQASVALQAARQQRQLAINQQLRRRLFLTFGAAAVALLLFVVAVTMALNARAQAAAARENARLASSRQLAAQALTYADDPELALLLGLEANNIADTIESRFSLVSILGSARFLTRAWDAHDTDITRLAYAPAGQLVASGGLDGQVRLWDVAGGGPLGRAMAGNEGRVLGLAFSSDGARLAVTGEFAGIRLFDVATQTLIAELSGGHEFWVHAVAFSPDDKWLATGAADHQVLLWDMARGQPVEPALSFHTDEVNELAFSPDGRWLASAGRDNQIVIWDVERATVHRVLLGHTDWVSDIAFSSTSERLASVSFDGQIRRWRVADGAPLGEPLDARQGSLSSIAFTPDDLLLISAGRDKTIRLWDSATGAAVGDPLYGHADEIRALAVSPDGDWVVSGDRVGKILLWDLRGDNSLGKRYFFGEAPLSALQFQPGGALFATASRDGTVALWDLAGRRQMGPHLVGPAAGIETVVFSPDGTVLAAGSREGAILFWDVAERQLLDIIPAAHTGIVESLAYSPAGDWLASAGTDRRVVIWDTATLTIRTESFVGLGAPVESLTFSPDGSTLVTGETGAGRLLAWDLAASPPLSRTIATNVDWVHRLLFSPDGQLLASAHADNTISLWELAGPEIIGQTLGAHRGEVDAIAFSPDGAWLASGGRDNVVILWDLARRRPIASFVNHQGAIQDVAFTADSRYLASASADGSFIFWDTEISRWRELACAKVSRNLTAQEWTFFVGELTEEAYRSTCP
ncbi:MAG: hypothetical protein KDE59_12955 [Anaerolineales bacterium]|nr:hypothetical protein [Anaerolineales bacterium]